MSFETHVIANHKLQAPTNSSQAMLLEDLADQLPDVVEEIEELVRYLSSKKFNCGDPTVQVSDIFNRISEMRGLVMTHRGYENK